MRTTPGRRLHVKEGSETEQLEIGDVITAKDRTFVWTEHHLKNSELEPWRQLSDPLADRALSRLPSLASSASCSSTSPFDQIRHHVSTCGAEELDPDVGAFWRSVTAPAPLWPALGESQAARERERRLVAEGQRVYVKYAAGIGLALLHFSLAGGFSSPRVVRVLELTSYLIPGSESHPSSIPSCPLSPQPADKPANAVFERLLETGQWHNTCMDSLDTIQPPCLDDGRMEGGRGWEDTIRVRLLHAQMRAKVLKAAERARTDSQQADVDEPWSRRGYSVEADGVPLNQEDMAATLAAFAVAPLWSLERMGFRITLREKESYLALWRHLGYYLGVAPHIIDGHFTSWPRADAFLLSSVLHLFSFPKSASTLARLPTVPVLRAVAGRPPFASSLEFHFAMAQALLGDELAADVGIPPAPLKMRLRVQLSFLVMRFPIVFGAIYPRKGWERARQECIRRALPRIVARNMGGRRSRFVRGADRWTKVDVEGEEWKKEGEEITRVWKAVWREFGAVLAGCAVFSAALAWIGLKAWVRT